MLGQNTAGRPEKGLRNERNGKKPPERPETIYLLDF
jgi:hypothetical protein